MYNLKHIIPFFSQVLVLSLLKIYKQVHLSMFTLAHPKRLLTRLLKYFGYRLVVCMSFLVLSSCSLAPRFKLPEAPLTKTFKDQPVKIEETAKGVWKEARLLQGQERGQWWKVFGDSTLDTLQVQAIEANQTLKAASARLEQARSQVRSNAASIFPSINIGANALRAKASSASTVGFSSGPLLPLKPYTLYSTGATASYEADIFGRVRDNEKALKYDADAQTSLYLDTLLALQADVAQHYFQLQALDAERALLKETVMVRTEAERIMQKRFKAGSVGAVDVSHITSELASAKADLIRLDRQRAVFENALAVLLGKNPSEYHFPETPLTDSPPPLIPSGIPSDVLQRRPDIASAQAAMKAANRRIGVARTAFFPSINLTASGGYESTNISDIFKWSNRSWALGQTAGSALMMNIFDSGRTLGKVAGAHAKYEEAVANYRQQVLVAMSEVENALTDQRLLADQVYEQKIAAAADERTNELTKKRYAQGDASYFEVVDAQRAMLASSRAAIQAHGSRQIATINLIRALGGGWPEENLKHK